MPLTVTVPKLNGDGKIATFSLQLPAGATEGKVVWTSGDTSKGTVTPSNDGKSALFTPVAAGTTLITAAITTAAGVVSPWQPGHLYRVGDTIVDQNSHLQTVTAGAKKIPTVHTPNAGKIPLGGEAGYYVAITLTVSAGSAGGPTNAYTISPTVAAGVSNGFAGRTFEVSGFVSNPGNNGKFLCVASSTSSLTLVNANGVNETPSPASGKGLSIGVASDPQGYGSILNQSDSGNGDWPAGAIAANSGNIATPYPVTAAPVSWIGAGYSRGRNFAGQTNQPSGLDSPLPVTYALTSLVDAAAGVTAYAGTFADGAASALAGVSFIVTGFVNPQNNGTFICTVSTTTHITLKNAVGVAETHAGFAAGVNRTDSRSQVASYSEYGPGGLKTYYDAAGNVKTGWQVAKSTEDFSTPAGYPPPFSTSGGSTVSDGDLVWTEGGAAATTTTFNNLTVNVSTAAGVPPVPYNWLVIQ